jgi:hypothetical protein
LTRGGGGTPFVSSLTGHTHITTEKGTKKMTTSTTILRSAWRYAGSYTHAALRVAATTPMAAALSLMMLVVAPSGPAHAATIFTVTNTTDANNICDSALREAITAANNIPNSGGPDLIRFNINQSGVQTIKPTSALPIITEAVIIDGYTQSGTSPNTLARGTNAKITVELDGSNAGPTADGLVTRVSNVVVRGLAINGFRFTGALDVNLSKPVGCVPSLGRRIIALERFNLV